jgi:YVTN family beta-propeller protein
MKTLLLALSLALGPARPEDPASAAPAADEPAAELLMLHKASSSLGFYGSDGRLLASVPVGKHPHEMVVSTDRRFAYTTDNGTMRIEDRGTGGNTVSIVDLRERRKVGEINLGEFRRPHGIDLDPRTGFILVTTELPDQLLVLDPVQRRIVRRYDTKGRTSHMVTLGRDGRYAYVSNSGSGEVAAVELESGRVTVIPTGERPEGSVLSADGKRLYVANRQGHSIAIIDTEQQKLAGHIRTGNGPVRVARTPDGRLLVWALFHERAVEFADPDTRQIVGRVPLKEGALVSISVSPDGSRAFASAQEIDRVYVLSVPERKLVREIPTAAGAGPDPVLALPARKE